MEMQFVITVSKSDIISIVSSYFLTVQDNHGWKFHQTYGYVIYHRYTLLPRNLPRNLLAEGKFEPLWLKSFGSLVKSGELRLYTNIFASACKLFLVTNINEFFLTQFQWTMINAEKLHSRQDLFILGQLVSLITVSVTKNEERSI